MGNVKRQSVGCLRHLARRIRSESRHLSGRSSSGRIKERKYKGFKIIRTLHIDIGDVKDTQPQHYTCAGCDRHGPAIAAQAAEVLFLPGCGKAEPGQMCRIQETNISKYREAQ